MKKFTIYIDGKYISCSQEVLDAFMPGTFKARGVFETMRAIDGKIAFVPQHLERLQAGLKVLGIKRSDSSAKITAIIHRVIKKNTKLKDARVRVMIFQQGKDVHCAVMAVPYTAPSVRQYKQGLRALMIKTNRSAVSHLANVKSLDYSLFADAYAQAKAQGYDEALLLNRKGHVFEASRGNIFILKGGVLMTPPLSSGCLNGIIRQQVMAMAKHLPIPILVRNCTPAMIKSADKVFLTNSMVGIIPLVL